jgi:hypothetical protein
VSYTHYWDPGAQPLPCQEHAIEVQRSAFDWLFDASHRRRVQSATLVATQNAQSKQLCVHEFQEMVVGFWSYSFTNTSATNDYGQNWTEVFPVGAGTGRSMNIVQGSTPIPMTVNGSTLTADVTAKMAAGSLGGGFAIPNDGFPIPTTSTPDHSIYPENNDSCGTGFDSVVVNATYNPVTPDTPMNCSAVVNCNQFTVTCDGGSLDSFEVHQNDNGRDTIVGTAQGTLTGTVTITGTENLVGAPLTVCAATHGATLQDGKLTTCTSAIAVTSDTACPVVCPVCPAGYTCQSGPGYATCVPAHICPVGTHACTGGCCR